MLPTFVAEVVEADAISEILSVFSIIFWHKYFYQVQQEILEYSHMADTIANILLIAVLTKAVFGF